LCGGILCSVSGSNKYGLEMRGNDLLTSLKRPCPYRRSSGRLWSFVSMRKRAAGCVHGISCGRCHLCTWSKSSLNIGICYESADRGREVGGELAGAPWKKSRGRPYKPATQVAMTFKLVPYVFIFRAGCKCKPAIKCTLVRVNILKHSAPWLIHQNEEAGSVSECFRHSTNLMVLF